MARVRSGNSFLPKGGAAIAMVLTTTIAIGAVVYSHDSQIQDRKKLREGVERDKERLRRKRKEETLRKQQDAT